MVPSTTTSSASRSCVIISLVYFGSCEQVFNTQYAKKPFRSWVASCSAYSLLDICSRVMVLCYTRYYIKSNYSFTISLEIRNDGCITSRRLRHHLAEGFIERHFNSQRIDWYLPLRAVCIPIPLINASILVEPRDVSLGI